MKRLILFSVLLVTVSSCHNASGKAGEESTPAAGTYKKAEHTESAAPAAPVFAVQDKSELTALDFEAAYAMSKTALTEYYKAIWNSSDIKLDTYFANANLTQYTQQKMSFLHDMHHKNKASLNAVTAVEAGVVKAELRHKDETAYFYLKLAAHVKQDTGSFGEPTEFLVQSVDGRLVIADWYSGGKDSYDCLVRGENQVVDNPGIWKNDAWAMTLLDSKKNISPMR